jgi:hypothetical protein
LLSLAIILVLLSRVVYHSLKVVELVSLLLVVNYVVDLMKCVIFVLCMLYIVYSACFEGSPSGEEAKIGSGKKNKTLIFVSWGHASVTGHLRGPM